MTYACAQPDVRGKEFPLGSCMVLLSFLGKEVPFNSILILCLQGNINIARPQFEISRTDITLSVNT